MTDNQLAPASAAAQLQQKLEHLAALKAQEAEFAPIKQEIEQTRIDIQAIMQKVASKRTDAVAGIFAVREERRSVAIVDEEAVADWLTENAMDVMAYYKLNPAALKVLAEETKQETGELIPGMNEIVTETISIRTAK